MTTQTTSIFAALATAAAEFEAEDFGDQFYDEDRPQLPRALYVQRDTNGDWRAAFRPAEDMDAEMTRWATGAEAERIFGECIEGIAVAQQIEEEWDSDWDECA